MGDIIVCFAEQRDGLLHKPLKQVLEENLDATDIYHFRSLPTPLIKTIVVSLPALWFGSGNSHCRCISYSNSHYVSDA